MSEPFNADHHLSMRLQTSEVSGFCKAGMTIRANGYSVNPYNSLNLGLHVGDDANHVVANRKKLADSIELPLQHWVFAEQIHGHHIKKVQHHDCGSGTVEQQTSLAMMDGLYTNETNIMLALAFADCVPLFFYAPDNGYMGIAHAGWKGTVSQIGPKLLDIWERKEAIALNHIYVTIGPSICSDCYEVDDDLIHQVESVLLKHDKKPYRKMSDHSYALDLKKLNYILLLRTGLPAEHIRISRYCTSCHAQYFFSHRRDGGETGRMLGYIGQIANHD